MSQNKKRNPRKSLLKDLESIRGLLNTESELKDDQVPLLDDVVAKGGVAKGGVAESGVAESGVAESGVAEGGASLHQKAKTDTQVFGQITEQTVLGDELFQALLGDDWTTSTAEILEKARASIQELDTDWSSEFIDDLNEALKVRINETVHTWLHSVIVRQADELRGAIIQALSEEIASNINQLSSNLNSEGADGK